MSVQRIVESPRVTKPYSDEQWRAVDAFGRRIEQQLTADDVRVTIGGEPTFVAMDDPDAPEWNTAATGPTKRRFAADLIRAAARALRAGRLAALRAGQVVSRRAVAALGVQSLLAPRRQGAVARRRADCRGEATTTASRPRRRAQLLTGVARTSRARPRRGHAGLRGSVALHRPGTQAAREPRRDHEPPRRSDGARAARTRLRAGLEQARRLRAARAALERGGLAATRRWSTERWTTRSGKLFLVPGDSPLGFRLPLPSLIVSAAVAVSAHRASRSVRRARARCRTRIPQRQPFLQRREARGAAPATDVRNGRRRARHARTAITVEPRDGRLCVFMPPVAELEDYLDLLAAVEDASAELDLPIHLEGYEPPRDPRLNVIKVTPDPGVIEVNVQPAASWDEMLAITEGLYEDAHYTRLVTEKFMLDGRHTGTGGGNHVVLGGARAADSPFLRRPDLLRSLITYWQHHPALSYLFSGMFIGPDEPSAAHRRGAARLAARARARVQAGGSGAAARAAVARRPLVPQFADRRHAATRIAPRSASTSCIRPTGPTGRLGLVEFRAFEMPPHPRMSLVQQLLLLSLVARFWREPYAPRSRALGHAAARQVHAAVSRLARPRRRHRRHEPRRLRARRELVRAALRVPFPALWHRRASARSRSSCARRSSRGTCSARRARSAAPCVMSTRRSSGCRSRCAGSPTADIVIALQRLARAADARRAAPASCVGGVRYRAWQPASSLHPTIPVDAPLTFDLYDRWSGRAVAGCTYHVAHPGRPQLRARSPSMPTRRRAGGSRASSRSATPPARIPSRSRSRAASFRTHSICAGPTE